MRSSGKGSGGGLGSKNVVRPGYKSGPGARAANVRWTSQIGASQGNRAQNALDGGGGVVLKGIRAQPFKGPNFNPVPQGNAVAASSVCGVGGSRTIIRTGGQGQHGPVNRGNPAPKGELFPGFPTKQR
jgi:hypothetical protein